jgi:hypothetical protein
MRVYLTFSFEVEDEQAFVKQADECCMKEWGSPLGELVYPKFGQSIQDATLVQAVFETFVGSNGSMWPDGTAGDANVDYFGSVDRVERGAT